MQETIPCMGPFLHLRYRERPRITKCGCRERWGGSARVLRTSSLSTPSRQPREISTARAGPAETPGGLSPLLACKTLSGRPIHPHCRLRDISGGQACLALACGSGYRHRLQRNQRALYRGAQAEIQPEQSPSLPASHRAGRRSENELRSNHLHRGSPSSRGARCGAQRSARCAQPGRRSDASHGVCALRTDWHLHAAGILQTDRRPCQR